MKRPSPEDGTRSTSKERRPLRRSSLLVGIALASASVGVGASITSPVGASSTTSTTAPTAGVVWMCRPGVSPDPCTSSLDATSVSGNGRTVAMDSTKPAKNPPIDCFYVYPTVVPGASGNAPMTVTPQTTGAAVAQASRFSTVCRIFAPVYPQGTTGGFHTPQRYTEVETGYEGVVAAWNDYLQHYNDGRAFVLIGHSQGSSVLEKLVQHYIDNNPKVRGRMLSALLLGGNMLVESGHRTGGYFQHVPTCNSSSELGCVVAYSSFYGTPPDPSVLGRAGTPTGIQAIATAPKGVPLAVVCVNPAMLVDHSNVLDDFFPTSSSPAETDLDWWPKFAEPTPWVTYPGLYQGQCMNQDGAQWLDVTVHQGSVARPTVQESLGPSWGLHLSDVNLSVGDLVELVRDETSAYQHEH